MWYEERVDISKNTTTPMFNLCCKQGLISLPPLKPTPAFLDSLLDITGGTRSSRFRDQIRAYNSVFQFTSLGASVDNSINIGPGPYVFKLSGQNYHRIGSLLPPAGQRPKYAQLYVYDSESEVSHRMLALGVGNKVSNLEPEIVCGLTDMLNQYNELVKVFRRARDFHSQFPDLPVKIKLVASRTQQGRNYSLPAVQEIAALIVGDIGMSDTGRDIMVEHREEGLKRISDLHPSFMALQYPLLFPYGEDCFHLDIPYTESPVCKKLQREHLTMLEYYAYHVQQRFIHQNTLLRGGRLFQQFFVDAYAIVEETRLRYIRENQRLMRSEMYKNIRDAMSGSDMRANTIGNRIVLPASFVPGPRYLFEKYQDAMAICRYYGYPNLFITFTCNARWAEIKDALKLIRGQRPEDRPDIVSRVFRIKLRHLLADLTDNEHFGKTKAG